MSAKKARPVGLTKDTGWQIGHRRTVDAALADVWALLISPPGVRLWLGDAGDLEIEKGARYRTSDGTSGEVRVFRPDSHLRITRQPGSYPRPSTIQIRVMPSRGKTVIVFHEEHLPSQTEREVRRTYYKAAADAIEAMIGSGSSLD